MCRRQQCTIHGRSAAGVAQALLVAALALACCSAEPLLRGAHSKATTPVTSVQPHILARKLQQLDPATGKFTSITLRLDICGHSPDASVQEVRSSLFGDGLTLQSYYKQCSFGALDVNDNPSENLVVSTPIPIRGSAFCNGGSVKCDIDAIAAAAEQYADKSLKIDMTQYAVKIILFPGSVPGCGFYGMARQGCFTNNPGPGTPARLCRVWLTTPVVRAMMHETGHSLGLGHSMEGGQDAADQTCPMSNYGTYNCPNAYHSSLLGWTTAIDTIDMDDLNGGDWQQVRLPPRVASSRNFLKLTGQGADIFVSYTAPVGWESAQTGNNAKRLLAHSKHTNSDWSRSQILANLGAGDRDNLGGGYPRFVLRLDDGASLAGGVAQVCRADNSGDCKPGSEPSGDNNVQSSQPSDKKKPKKKTTGGR